jgi:hypothetical protein
MIWNSSQFEFDHADLLKVTDSDQERVWIEFYGLFSIEQQELAKIDICLCVCIASCKFIKQHVFDW